MAGAREPLAWEVVSLFDSRLESLDRKVSHVAEFFGTKMETVEGKLDELVAAFRSRGSHRHRRDETGSHRHRRDETGSHRHRRDETGSHHRRHPDDNSKRSEGAQSWAMSTDMIGSRSPAGLESDTLEKALGESMVPAPSSCAVSASSGDTVAIHAGYTPILATTAAVKVEYGATDTLAIHPEVDSEAYAGQAGQVHRSPPMLCGEGSSSSVGETYDARPRKVYFDDSPESLTC